MYRKNIIGKMWGVEDMREFELTQRGGKKTTAFIGNGN